MWTAVVGQVHPECVLVGVGVRDDRLPAEQVGGADDPDRDLPAVGDQDAMVGHPAPYSMTAMSWPTRHFLPVLDEELLDRAGAGGLELGEALHHLDQTDRLPLGDLVADRDELVLVWCGLAVEDAGHGRLHGAHDALLSSCVGVAEPVPVDVDQPEICARARSSCSMRSARAASASSSVTDVMVMVSPVLAWPNTSRSTEMTVPTVA